MPLEHPLTPRPRLTLSNALESRLSTPTLAQSGRFETRKLSCAPCRMQRTQRHTMRRPHSAATAAAAAGSSATHARRASQAARARLRHVLLRCSAPRAGAVTAASIGSSQIPDGKKAMPGQQQGILPSTQPSQRPQLGNLADGPDDRRACTATNTHPGRTFRPRRPGFIAKVTVGVLQPEEGGLD